MQTLVKPVPFDLRQLQIPPGNTAILQGISWADYERILKALGEGYAIRLTYNQGSLKLQMPLPKHEKAKALIGAFLTVLLEELDMESECLASTTFKSEKMQQGIEPDDCFYIQNQAAVRGKDRLDLDGGDPPPDLAIEVDNTNETDLEVYQGLGVPEVWVYDCKTLKIYWLEDGGYVEATQSRSFPGWPIIDGVMQHLALNQTMGRTAVIKAFRAWVCEQ